MKELLVDYIPFEISRDRINESIKDNNGRLIVKGVLQRAEAKNQNGRIYPRETLVREAKKYAKVNVKERRRYTDAHYLKTSNEMYETFRDLPEALENNVNFPFRISYRPRNSLPVLPNIETEKIKDVD